MNKNNGYPIWIIRLRQQEAGSNPHVFAPNHVDESEPELVQTAVRQQRRRKTGATKVDNRSHRNPVTAGRFEPRRLRAPGDATMNTNECSSQPRGHNGFFPPPNSQLPSVYKFLKICRRIFCAT